MGKERWVNHGHWPRGAHDLPGRRQYVTNTHINSWCSTYVLHIIIKIAAECQGSREEAKVNARWGDWRKVHHWTDSEFCVGKCMEFQKAEFNGRVFCQGDISLEYLSVQEVGAFQTPVHLFQRYFSLYYVWSPYPRNQELRSGRIVSHSVGRSHNFAIWVPGNFSHLLRTSTDR